jgi:hypothetical protein
MRALKNPPHLNYYRLLEQDLEACFRFVEPTSDHHQVHSVEFARIILMASSGVENALNDFAVWAQSDPKPTNILQHFASTHEKFPKFHTMNLLMPKYGLGLVPWDGWSSSAAPDWWTFGYNKIKHDRSSHPGAATLIRAIKAVGALQVLLLHYYRLRYKDAAIADRGIPELLVPWDRDDPMSGASTLWLWDLPDDSKDTSTNSG